MAGRGGCDLEEGPGPETGQEGPAPPPGLGCPPGERRRPESHLPLTSVTVSCGTVANLGDEKVKPLSVPAS